MGGGGDDGRDGGGEIIIQDNQEMGNAQRELIWELDLVCSHCPFLNTCILLFLTKERMKETM